MCLILGDGSNLYAQTISTYKEAVTSGTAANRLRQSIIYIKFCLAYNVNYLNPTIMHLSMFVRFLANSFKPPSTVKNYLAGSKTWVQNHMGNMLPFSSPQVRDMLQSITRLSSHIPTPAFPLSPNDIAIICQYIDSRPWFPLCVKPCLLIAYATFLRSSNLLSPTLTSWGGPHTLTCNDIIPSPLGLQVVVRSSKTIKPGRPVILHVLRIPHSTLCPVSAWEMYISNVNPCRSGPAFVLHTSAPLTPRPLVKIMRAALKQAGRPYAPYVSMHSLRRGASQAASDEGAPVADLLKHGTWKSKTVLKNYLKPSTIVPRLMANSLAV